MKSKICTKCKIEKPISCFGKHKKAKDGYRWWCKDCSKENTKEWAEKNPERKKAGDRKYYEKNKEERIQKATDYYRRNRKAVNAYHRKRVKQHKEKAIKYKGGKCQLCGYNKCVAALDFHHINPFEKEYECGHLMNKAWKNIKEEIDKCVLLCSNCHREIHYYQDR